MKKTCYDCYWLKVNNENCGECHYNAPTMLSGAGTGFSKELWPRVRTDDFCSKFEFDDQRYTEELEG